MKYLPPTRALIDFVAVGSPSLDSIFRFLALDSLYPLSAVTVLLNVVRIDGSVHIPTGFGYPEGTLALIPERSVGVDTPVNQALRTGRITNCGNFDEFLFAGPDHARKLFPNGFNSSFAWPIPAVGVVETFCSEKISLTEDDEEYLRVLGGILSMQLGKPEYRERLGLNREHTNPITSVALTPRQWIIVSAIKKGLTNPAIASELEFSESLIRQETVQSYRKMGVSGRKELMDRAADIEEITSQA